MSQLLINGPLSDGNAQSDDSAASSNLRQSAASQLSRYHKATNLHFMCIATSTGEVLAKTDEAMLELLPQSIKNQPLNLNGVRVIEEDCGLTFYALPLQSVDALRLVAIGYVLNETHAQSQDAVLIAAENGWSQNELDQWTTRQHCCDPELLERLLTLAYQDATSAKREADLNNEIAELGEQIEHTYEEISLLHSLTQNLQISRSPASLAELCLRRIPELIPAAGTVIWIENKEADDDFLVEGTIPFERADLTHLIARFKRHDWSRPLVKNHLEGTSLGSDFPNLRNFVIAPIAEGTNRFGWSFSCNLKDGLEFGTVEASLLNSIGTIIGTHLRNIELYQQHEDLLLSLVRSFVSTLDAKDPYTRGHSERVALISRRIGQELNLTEENLDDIYLSGLLHDIGKIGIDDRILRKPGKLTPAEFEQIKLHPMIGYEILKGLSNLQVVLPGVRSHHEQMNGEGYPDGLVGKEIPLMARIMAVADSYDAMGSDRPYRKGMPLEKMESIFREGSGSQWDSSIIDAYFLARDDIVTICIDHQKANSEPSPNENPSD